MKLFLKAKRIIITTAPATSHQMGSGRYSLHKYHLISYTDICSQQRTELKQISGGKNFIISKNCLKIRVVQTKEHVALRDKNLLSWEGLSRELRVLGREQIRAPLTLRFRPKFGR